MLWFVGNVGVVVGICDFVYALCFRILLLLLCLVEKKFCFVFLFKDA